MPHNRSKSGKNRKNFRKVKKKLKYFRALFSADNSIYITNSSHFQENWKTFRKCNVRVKKGGTPLAVIKEVSYNNNTTKVGKSGAKCGKVV